MTSNQHLGTHATRPTIAERRNTVGSREGRAGDLHAQLHARAFSARLKGFARPAKWSSFSGGGPHTEL